MKKAVKPAVAVLLIFAVLFFLQELVTPKYMEGATEGAFIAEYYDDEPDHDVIFLGDCEVYENFTPAVLWKEYGINSYVRGSAKQLMWQSYYLLLDTLRYEKPDVVVLSVLAMKYDTPQSEAYNRITLDGMRWGSAKIDAIKASMTDEESFIEYVFPILRFHERITDLNKSDFKYLFKKDKVSYNGYYMRTDVKPAKDVPVGEELEEYAFGENAMTYLKKIADTCEEEGIGLVLVKAPSVYPYWYEEWEEQIEGFANEQGLIYVNYLELFDETGVDLDTDTYDGGLHMNLAGATKITSHLGKVLVDEFGLSDRRNEEKQAAAWKEKLERYEKAAEAGTTPDMSSADATGLLKNEKPVPKTDGYVFRAKGTEIVMDAQASDVIAGVGEPTEYFEAPSCAFLGTDRTYGYGSFEIRTYPVDGIDYISAVIFNDDLVETKEGIYIGSSEEEVMLAYGEPGSRTDRVLNYEKNGTRLRIFLEDGIVSAIQYFSTAAE